MGNAEKNTRGSKRRKDIAVERRERVRKEYRLGVLVVEEDSRMGWWYPFREAYRGRVVGDAKANANTAVELFNDSAKAVIRGLTYPLPNPALPHPHWAKLKHALCMPHPGTNNERNEEKYT